MAAMASQAASMLQEMLHAQGSPVLLLSLAALAVLPPLLLLVHLTTAPPAASAGDADALLRRLPSPPRLPVIGHMHLVGALPHVSLAALAAAHGPDLLLLRLGAVATVVASSPRAAEAVLRTHDHALASRPRSMVADVVIYGAADSCYSPYGDHFRRVRKLVAVHLLNSHKVQAYRPAREEEVRLVLRRLAAGGVVDVSEAMNSFANDLICRAVSGKFFREEGRNRLFRELIDTNAALLGGFNLEDYFPRLAGIGVVSELICARAKKVRRRWDQLLDKLIDDHAAKAVRRGGDGGEDEEKDFIDVLLSRQEEYGLTRDHMKAILVDMFEAGTETSSLTLECAMAELMRKPHIMAKLQEEVRRNVPKGQEMVTEDDLANLTYLKAVIKETLRLHPAAPLMIPHFSMEACEIMDGYTIPAGTRVIVNAWAIGRLSSHWDMAEEFMPERFMDGDPTSVDIKGKDFRYLPFGSGRRMCPGIHAAAATLEIMLANLVYRFDWELPAGMKKEDIDMTEVFGLTVHRKEKLLLVPKIVA
ncbi:hypothetical protein ACP4OV_018479 [Aristida adscensionis]